MASRSSVVLCAFVVASLLLAAAEVHASARKLRVDIEPDGRETKVGTEKDVTPYVTTPPGPPHVTNPLYVTTPPGPPPVTNPLYVTTPPGPPHGTNPLYVTTPPGPPHVTNAPYVTIPPGPPHGTNPPGPTYVTIPPGPPSKN